jgi:hypothetical protein
MSLHNRKQFAPTAPTGELSPADYVPAGYSLEANPSVPSTFTGNPVSAFSAGTSHRDPLIRRAAGADTGEGGYGKVV